MTPAELFADDRITFGVTAPRMLADVAALEAAGVESFWAGGHIASMNPTPEVITDLAMLAAVTTTAVVGSAVLVLPLYSPVIVAKQLAELDERTEGRVVLGVGAGGEYPREFEACGVPLTERGSRLDDGIGMLRHLWSGSGTRRVGTYFSVGDVRLQPGPHTPSGPPIVISGRSDRPIRRAALLGDGWMPHLYSVGRYATSRQTILSLASEAGRDLSDFGWMLYMILAVSTDMKAAQTAGGQFLQRMVGKDKAAGYAANIAAVGDAAQVTERLCAYVDVGARHFVFLVVPGLDPMETGRLLTEEVMPAVRAHHELSAGEMA